MKYLKPVDIIFVPATIWLNLLAYLVWDLRGLFWIGIVSFIVWSADISARRTGAYQD